MGVTLNLAVLEYHDSDLAYTRFRLRNCSLTLAAELKERSMPMEKKVLWYDDDGIAEKTEDHYGEELRYVPAGLASWALNVHSRHTWDRAVSAYLSVIPNDAKVVLFWD